MTLSGGCQCGAVRFQVQRLGGAALCHCRMCQKAFGSYFAPLVTAPIDALAWTRGEPSYFQSSSMATRGFCAACGTPLTYQSRPDEVELAIGAFDDPGAVPLTAQGGAEAMHEVTQHLGDLPRRPTSAHFAGLTSFQHPDHDTKDWSPKPPVA